MPLRVENRTHGTMLADRAVLARRAADRLRGLLPRAGLDAGEALVLMPCAGIHTFGMRFPIDLVLVDRQLRVIAAREAIRPNRIATLRPCYAALELPVGVVRSSRTAIGDSLEFRDEPAGEPVAR
jgi:hypothetical protein